MGIFRLFDNFNETIFVKTDNNLESEIEELKKIRNDSNKEQIDKEIKLLELGLSGEKQIEFELKHANLGLYVLHDVILKHEDLVARIDYVVVSKYYTYFIECKNLIGNISVNSNGEFRRDYSYNGKQFQEAIYSPITQVKRYKDIYEKLWKSQNTSFLDRTLWKDAVSRMVKTLVVLSNSKGLLNINDAPNEIKERTIRVDNLINYIKKDLEKFNKDLYNSKKDMEQIANRWLARCQDTSAFISDKYKNKVEVVTETPTIRKRDIKLDLENLRKNRMKDMKIPAYYIFTNDELEQIILKTPSTMEELGKILPPIKIKVHGKEILAVLNNNDS